MFCNFFGKIGIQTALKQLSNGNIVFGSPVYISAYDSLSENAGAAGTMYVKTDVRQLVADKTRNSRTPRKSRRKKEKIFTENREYRDLYILCFRVPYNRLINARARARAGAGAASGYCKHYLYTYYTV